MQDMYKDLSNLSSLEQKVLHATDDFEAKLDKYAALRQTVSDKYQMELGDPVFPKQLRTIFNSFTELVEKQFFENGLQLRGKAEHYANLDAPILLETDLTEFTQKANKIFTSFEYNSNLIDAYENVNFQWALKIMKNLETQMVNEIRKNSSEKPNYTFCHRQRAMNLGSLIESYQSHLDGKNPTLSDALAEVYAKKKNVELTDNLKRNFYNFDDAELNYKESEIIEVLDTLLTCTTSTGNPHETSESTLSILTKGQSRGNTYQHIIFRLKTLRNKDNYNRAKTYAHRF